MVEAAQERVGRRDISLAVAAPAEYARVARLSQSASPSEMRSPLTAELIEWFVDRNPCGRGFVVTASSADSAALIGYFLFYPWVFAGRSADSHGVTSFLFVRLYVAPSHRRQKVFAAMTAFGLDLVTQLGVGLAYTVPNPRSAPGFLKFGMQPAGVLPFWIKPVLPGWTGRRWAVRHVNDLSVDRCTDFSDSWRPDFTPALPQSTELWCPRSPEFLRWRYVQRPEGAYEIRSVRRRNEPLGYLVTRRMRISGLRALVVCDAWFNEPSEGALREAVLDAVRSGSRVDLAIAFGGAAAPTYRRALRGAGFFVCPPRLQPQDVVIIACSLGEAGQRVNVPPTAQWHLTPLDWDVF
jgi:GNAT superfamily N-acetyltransferase